MAATPDERGSADSAEAPGQGADASEQEPAGANDDADPPPGAVATPEQKQSGRIRRWSRSARRLPAFFKLLAAISAAALTALLVLAVIATAQAVFDDGYDDGWFAYSTNTGPNGRDLIIEGVHHNGPGGPDYVYDRFDAGFDRHCDDHGFGDACGRQRGLKHRGPQIGVNELLLGVLCPWPDVPTDGPSTDGDHATEDASADADADSEDSDADSGAADDG